MNYDYLLADLKRPYPSHPIWIEHLAKRVMFCLFLGLQTPLTPPPPTLRREWSKFAHERLQPSKKNFWFRLCYCSTAFFHNILQGISIIYTNNKLHNYSKCKSFRQVLLQRAGEILTDFSSAFHARELQFIFLIDRFFSLLFFKFFLQQQNK